MNFNDQMKIGIIIGGSDCRGWNILRLKESFQRRNVQVICFSFKDIFCVIDPSFHFNHTKFGTLNDFSAIILRTPGLGNLEQIFWRMNVLRILEKSVPTFNPPKVIERAVDKLQTSMLLEEAGIPTPKTIVVENVEEGINAFFELGEDIVLKPLFGSMGRGIIRINDLETAYDVFRVYENFFFVIYLQEFVPHGNRDIRAFIVGDEIVASMYRISRDNSWKTNICQGAIPKPCILDEQLSELALRTAKKLGCHYAGVDIIESESEPLVLEVNSSPAWSGLQAVTNFSIADRLVEYILETIRR